MTDFDNGWNDPGPGYNAPPVATLAPQTLNVGTSDRDKVVVTVKAGRDFDSPWVVFHADSNAEAADLLGAAEATGLFALVAQAAKALAGHFNVGNTLGGRPVQSPAAAEQQYQQRPAPAQQQAPQGAPPGAQAPSCPHGVKKYVAGTNAAGKPYKFWGCPAPKGDPSQCPPEWIR